jgi:stearoyl-CoA desaturase (delta-9 desaturase)
VLRHRTLFHPLALRTRFRGRRPRTRTLPEGCKQVGGAKTLFEHPLTVRRIHCILNFSTLLPRVVRERTELIHFVYSLILIAVMVQLSSFATSIYLHRCLAHRGLYLNPIVTFFSRLQLWLATGIVSKEWVAVHRKHHRHTDVEGDPHSPVLEGLWRILLGNAYYYAREAHDPETLAHFAPDIGNSWLDRHVFAYGPLGLGLGLLVCVLLVGPIWGPIAFVVQAGIYIFSNAVINGANHAVGYRRFDNTATNLRLVALITAGEGLHNNHHAYPTSARFSVARGEWDPSWPVIRLLTWAHLARPLRLAPHPE